MEESKEVENKKSIIKRGFSLWIEDNYNKAFILFLILAFIIRIWIFTKTLNQPLWWDEADYLVSAKKWAGLSLNNIWYYRRGFLWPLFCTLFFKLGLGETGIRFSMVLFSTGIIGISYFIIKELFSKKLALYTIIGLVFSWIFIFFTGRLLTDIPATFFILLSLLFFCKGYINNKGGGDLYLFSIFYALAVLTRMQFLMFAPIFFIYILTKEKFSFIKNKRLWIALGIFFLILSPQIYLYSSHYGNPVKDILSHYLRINTGNTVVTEGTFSFVKIFAYFLNLNYMLTFPIFLLFLLGSFFFIIDLFLGIDKIFHNENLRKYLFIFLWIIIPFLVLGYITEYVEQRYISSTLLFVFFIISLSLIKIEDFIKININLDRKKINLIILLFFVLLLAFPTISVLKYKSNLFFGAELTDSKKTSYLEVMQAGLWLKGNSTGSDGIIGESLPQLMYYSERQTYNWDHDLCERDSSLCKYKEGEAGFDELVKDKNPAFFVLSMFEYFQLSPPSVDFIMIPLSPTANPA